MTSFRTGITDGNGGGLIGIDAGNVVEKNAEEEQTNDEWTVPGTTGAEESLEEDTKEQLQDVLPGLGGSDNTDGSDNSNSDPSPSGEGPVNWTEPENREYINIPPMSAGVGSLGSMGRRDMLLYGTAGIAALVIIAEVL